jgi:hypothetical protein
MIPFQITQIDTLNLLLDDYNEQYAVPSWVWYMLIGCLMAFPIILAQGGKLDMEKLLSKLSPDKG